VLVSSISENVLNNFDKSPSFHSFDGKVYPYKSLVYTTLGSKSTNIVFDPDLSNDFANVDHVLDLPDPGGPIVKTQCLISNNSFN